MNKWPLLNLVLIINNVSIHNIAGICKLVEECGMHLMFLLAYSFDFNPIKLFFSIIKAWPHKNYDYINWKMQFEDGSIYNVLWQAVYSVTLKKARG